LASFGIPGFLADPKLELLTATGSVHLQNDDWGSGGGVAAGWASSTCDCSGRSGRRADPPGQRPPSHRPPRTPHWWGSVPAGCRRWRSRS
jgi:hypothetical protein